MICPRRYPLWSASLATDLTRSTNCAGLLSVRICAAPSPPMMYAGAQPPKSSTAITSFLTTQKTADRPAFALTLASPTGAVRLDLPAPDEELERAKRALGLDDLRTAPNTRSSWPVIARTHWARVLASSRVTAADGGTRQMPG